MKVILGSFRQISTPPQDDHYSEVRKGSSKYHEASINLSNDRSLDELDASLAPSINQPGVQFGRAAPSMSVTPSMKSHDIGDNEKLSETNMQLVKTLEAMMKAMDSMEKRNGSII